MDRESHSGPAPAGVHLERSADRGDAIDALAELLARRGGGRVGLTDLLGDLRFTARDSRWGRLAGRAVQRAIALDDHDQRDQVWWPQGITTSADARPDGTYARRRVVMTTSYAKPVDGVRRGSRLTVLDLDTLRYRHVLLVEATLDAVGVPVLAPLRIHAGGLVWAGDWLHVAATARGFVSFHVDDLMRVPDDNAHPDEIGVVAGADGEAQVASFGHHHVLPARCVHRAVTDEGHAPLRYSFLSLDREGSPPALVVGEYGRGDQTTRVARFDLDPETWLPTVDASGTAHPVVSEAGTRQMQGVVVARGRHHATVSQGPWLPGHVLAGQPGAWRRRRFAAPMGPEDLTYWPQSDTLWSVTEHPRRRWICMMPRGWFDRD